MDVERREDLFFLFGLYLISGGKIIDVERREDHFLVFT